MALNMQVIVTSGTGTVDVPEDRAADLQEAYEALKGLPKNRAITVTFDTIPEAKLFAAQGRTWAAAHEPALEFMRSGDIKGEPLSVTFRIYQPNPRGPLTAEEKAARQATREANRAVALAAVTGQ